MSLIGFSTGAIAKGDVRRALEILRPFHFPAVELSALRVQELPPLIEALRTLDLTPYRFISVHAPSRLQASEEQNVIELLSDVAARGWPIVVHPDVILSEELWKPLGGKLLIENSDKRKSIGRTAAELTGLFVRFPDANLCFDVGHARQVDPTMNEAYLILRQNGDRLRQIHLSEVNSFSRHDPLSGGAIEATGRIAHLIPPDVPIILEMLIDHGQSTIEAEIARAIEALNPAVPLPV